VGQGGTTRQRPRWHVQAPGRRLDRFALKQGRFAISCPLPARSSDHRRVPLGSLAERSQPVKQGPATRPPGDSARRAASRAAPGRSHPYEGQGRLDGRTPRP